jgi:glycosyltransferase involved in cell wall biosynthesis
MKILLSAAACSHLHGSEASIGWKVAKALAARHEVTVVTLRGFLPILEKAREDGLVPGSLDFIGIGRSWETMPAPAVEKSYWWAAYREYLAELPGAMDGLLRKSAFDLIHHVTFATWRLPVPLHDLGVPFVWGPVGGAERFPPGLLGILSPKAAMFEMVRYAGNFAASVNPRLRAMIRAADAVVASNPDALGLLRGLRGRDEGLHELLVTSFTPDERRALGDSPKPPRRDPEILHAFASGALEGRKGVSLVLDAIALAKRKGLRIRYRVGSHGPELEHLRAKVRKLGLENEVEFGAPMPREDYVRELLASDVYLLPSLRDNAPSTLMEAMLAGCVPVVADCGGPASIVSDDCGFRLPVSSRWGLTSSVSETLLALQDNPRRLQAMGEAARARILAEYTMENYLTRLETIYSDAMAAGRRRSASSPVRRPSQPPIPNP